MDRQLRPAAFLALLLPALLAACTSSSTPPAALPTFSDAAFPAMSLSLLAADPTGGDVNLHWEQFSCSETGVLAVRSDGSLWGWGADVRSESRKMVTVPTRIGRDSNWVKVSAGPPSWVKTRAGLKTDGSLWMWGENDESLLGTDLPYYELWEPVGGREYQAYHVWYPFTKVGGNDWADVAVGGYHVLAVKTDGSLWAWGARTSASLGDGILANRNDYEAPLRNQDTPERIGTGTAWRRVAAGDSFSLGLKADGSLWRWGHSLSGAAFPDPPLGDPANFLLAPQRVGSDSDRFTDFTAGDFFALAIHEDGSLWGWGGDSFSFLGLGDTPASRDPGPWKHIAAGTRHALAVKEDGTLWSWGMGDCGKLGNGSLGASGLMQVGAATAWEAVACGEEFSCALKQKNPDGKLWLWGTNDSGQLGNGFSSRVDLPAQVGTDGGWSMTSATYGGTFALRTDGTLWGWGINWNGQLGDGTTDARQLPGRIGAERSWMAVAAGSEFALALDADGSLWSWGYGEDGRLGAGVPVSRYAPARVGNRGWKAISAADGTSFGIASDGTLWSWGYDNGNQLGLGNDHFDDGSLPGPVLDWVVWSPTQVGSSAGWKQVATAFALSAAVNDDGSLWTWGDGSWVPLGNGLKFSSVPARVGTGNAWASVAVSGFHWAALKRDGSLWMWGLNDEGQLGDGTFTDQTIPARAGTGRWKAVALQLYDTLAVREDGTLWTWGGVTPTCPDDEPIGSNLPVQVGKASDWASVTAGETGHHWVALKTDGTLWSWGDNEYGQLGNAAAWSAYPVWIP
jgi:alpha-tubulin suppressor-like RCC1 family protein